MEKNVKEKLRRVGISCNGLKIKRLDFGGVEWDRRCDQGLGVGGGAATEEAVGLAAGPVSEARSRVKPWAWSFWTARRKA